jgi:hypothetical protein
MFTSKEQPTKEYPRLKGKAAELRHFGRPLLAVWNKHMTDMDPKHVAVKKALERSVRAEDILDESSLHVGAMPHDAAQELCSTTAEFLLIFSYLNREYLSAETPVLLFSITVKAHMLMHLALQCSHMNPVTGWCYMGEDFQHVMRILTASSCRGNKPHQAAVKVANKYTQGMDVRLKGSKVWR